METMIYFSAFLFNNDYFNLRFILDKLNEFEGAQPEEEFKLIEIKDNLSVIIYNPGKVSSKFAGFSVSAEFFLADYFFNEVASYASVITSSHFCFLGIVYNNIYNYLVVEKHYNDGFEGYANTDGFLEKIKIANGKLLHYNCKEIIDEIEEKQLDEITGYEFEFLCEEFNLTWEEFIETIVNSSELGKRIWPKKIVKGNVWDNPGGITTIPIVPLWKHLTSEYPSA